MAELKKINTKREIHIKLCLTLAKHGFVFLGTNDLGEVEGVCQECGHPIRYEQNFKDIQTHDEYIIGSDCMFKIYILSHWQNQIKDKDLENKHLQRAGKWLWIIHRDNYLERISEEIPQPKNYNENFKQLADDLKVLVLKVRVEVKKEIEKEKIMQRELGILRNEQNWLDSHGIDINKCNDWERNFLDTMYKAYNNGWVLSERQQNSFDKIKNKENNKQEVATNQNLGSVAIIDDISKNGNYTQLNDWERDFMDSIGKVVDTGYVLSEKQMEILEKIDEKLSNNEKTEDYKDFIGKKVSAWLINKKTGNWTEGTVKSVKKETDSAILCNVLFVDDGGLENTLQDEWIPKSQLIDDDFVL